MPTRNRRSRPFGSVRKLPSGRWQARYTGPGGATFKAPMTFDAKGDAETWLATVRADLARGTWKPPVSEKAATMPTLASYAAEWLDTRGLKPRTRELYDGILSRHILPTFGETPLDAITPTAVRSWHARLDTGPTGKAHAYSLLRTILATAVADDVISTQPCRIRGAGSSKRAKEIRPATLDELALLVDAMPARHRMLVLLAAWCGLRFGELTELRRKDLDMKNGVIRVRRGVTQLHGGGYVVGTPKSDAGARDVAVPPHLLPALAEHLLEHAGPGREGLVFPSAAGDHLAPSALYKVWAPAREKAGRPDLRFHDLRHTGAVLAASTGATLAELMARLGHSSPGAALRYQHAAAGRDKVIAEALSALAGQQRS